MVPGVTWAVVRLTYLFVYVGITEGVEVRRQGPAVREYILAVGRTDRGRGGVSQEEEEPGRLLD